MSITDSHNLLLFSTSLLEIAGGCNPVEWLAGIFLLLKWLDEGLHDWYFGNLGKGGTVHLILSEWELWNEWLYIELELRLDGGLRLLLQSWLLFSEAVQIKCVLLVLEI